MTTDSRIPFGDSAISTEHARSRVTTRTRCVPLLPDGPDPCTASICWDERMLTPNSASSFQGGSSAGSWNFVPSSVRIIGQVPEVLRKISEAQIQVPLACNEYFTDEQMSNQLQWDFTSKPFLTSQSVISGLSLDNSIWILHTAIQTCAQRFKFQYKQMTDWVLDNLGPTITERQSIKAGQEGFEEDVDRWKRYISEMMMVLTTEKDVDRDTAVSVVSEFVEQRGVRQGGERVQVCQVEEETAWI